MAVLTLRTLTRTGDTTKNSPLTNAEVDNNFINLDADLDTKAPIASPTFTGTAVFDSVTSLKLPAGTVGERPTGVPGYIRLNTTINSFEGFNGLEWGSIGGGAAGLGGDKVFWENDQVVSTSYTISAGKNAGTFGPIEVANGVTVTIPSGSVWTII